jgi:hypothetical protein
MLAEGISGSYAMFTVPVATLILCTRSQGHLKYGPPGGMTTTWG